MASLLIEDIQAELEKRKEEISFQRVNADEIRLGADGRLVTPNGQLRVAESGSKALAKLSGIPPDFFPRCPLRLQAAMFNGLWPVAAKHQKEQVGLVVRKDDLLVGIVDPRLALLSGAAVAEAVLEARPPEIGQDHLEISEFRLNGRLSLSLVSRQVQSEPRVGDVVRGGVDIVHSDIGEFATQISSHLLRLACRNGMLLPICQHEQRLRVRRAAEGNEETTLDKIREIASLAWTELDVKLGALRTLADETVNDPAALVRAIARKAGLNQAVTAEVLAALSADEMGDGGAAFDVINAFARVGTHSEQISQRTRRRMGELSGALIAERMERCPSCGALTSQTRYLPEE